MTPQTDPFFEAKRLLNQFGIKFIEEDSFIVAMDEHIEGAGHSLKLKLIIELREGEAIASLDGIGRDLYEVTPKEAIETYAQHKQLYMHDIDA